MRRAFHAGLGLLAMAAAILPMKAEANERVRFAQTSASLLYLPLYVAELTGIFEKNGIQPEIHYFKGGGSAALAAVVGGNMEVYLGAASSAVRSAQQTDAMVIAPLVTRYTIDLVVRRGVAEKLGITSKSTEAERFKSLKGLKIGVSGVGSGTHQIAQYALARGGLHHEKDATIVFVGGGAPSVAALAAERIDVATLSSPASEVAVSQHGATILVNGAGGGYSELDGYLYVALISTKRWVDAKPEAAKNTVKSFAQAIAMMRDPAQGPKARDLVHAKHFPKTDKAIFDQSWDRMLPAFASSTKLDKAQMKRVIDFLNEFSDKPVKVEIDKLFTDKLAAD
jgi:NitT/TauT family transport system substrate-binding protein